MKTNLIYCFICFTLGGVLGSGILISNLGDISVPEVSITPNHETEIRQIEPPIIEEPKQFQRNDLRQLTDTAYRVLDAISNQDYEALSAFVDKTKGVRFTSYSTVRLEQDLVFTTQDIKSMATDQTKYEWGSMHTDGTPISMTMLDYFKRYVAPINYLLAPRVAVDMVTISGNALENITEAYPECRFVEFSMPTVTPSNNGTDWRSLKLVFEEDGTSWSLVGVIHAEWIV